VPSYRLLLGLEFCKISFNLAVTGDFVVNFPGFGQRMTTTEGEAMSGIVEFPQLVQRVGLLRSRQPPRALLSQLFLIAEASHACSENLCRFQLDF